MSQEAGWKQKVDLFRKRFGAREDVFGVKYFYTQTEYSPEDVAKVNPMLVEKSIYQPQCMNYGNQNVCLIAQNRGGCTTCEHKKPQPLTDEWIWKHIDGQKELILYLVQKDGVKFGACDFDRGTHFEDAKAVRDRSREFGLPCYIARSSKKGYHLYWFFSTPVQPHLFTSLVNQIYMDLGFLERYQENPSNPPPEVFPKQVTFNPSTSNPGNGIKVPMIEKKFSEGFNCWVKDDATPLSPDEQWDYLKSCVEVTPEQLDQAIAKNNIPILYAPVGRSRRFEAEVGPDGQPVPKQSIKPKGDFWRVVNNCPALKQFWEKDEDGTFKFDKLANGNGVPHTARVASLAFAVATENGIQAIRERWGSQRTEKEIDYALRTTQHPHTCRAMQENGICRIGIHPTKKDHCIEKVPPGEVVNGQYRVNPDNLPESEWKDPSPIRFAGGFQSKPQLTGRIDRLLAFRNQKDGVPPANLDEELKDILRSSWNLDLAGGKEVRDYIEVQKAMKAKELKKLSNSIEKEVKEKEIEERREEYPNFSFNSCEFFERPTGYFMVKRDPRGIPYTTELTNFTVKIKEELTLILPQDLDDPKEESAVMQRYIKGVLFRGKERNPFKVPADELFRDSSGFFALMTRVAGTAILYNTANYNDIRNCISKFSETDKVMRKKVEDFGHYLLRGKHAFVSPSVIITKDQIKPNNEFELEFQNETARCLDFKIIDESQFKDLALHIINDYFECNNSLVTMCLFAHALSACITSHLPTTKNPVLWVEGSFGQGKSFIAEVAQCFYGNFSRLSASDSTAIGKLAIAHVFRDAFLVFDDFKRSLSDYNAKQVLNLIQKAYDRSGREAAQRNGKPREDSTRIRGVICITGEDPPFEEASTISRTIIAEIKKNRMNVEKGERVKERHNDYCGFTPYLIQFVYNLGEAEVKKIYREYLEYFQSKDREGDATENMFRVSENLSFNMTTFRLAMDLLIDRGVILAQKRDELCQRHLKNLSACREIVLKNTVAQRGSTLFLGRLKELLQDPARYHIAHLPGFDPTEHKNSKPIGFCRESDPGIIFVHPGTAHGEVEQALGKSKSWGQSPAHIARQLFEDNHLSTYDSKSTNYTKYVKTPAGNRMYCWAIRMSSLGFTPDGDKILAGGEEKEKEPGPLSLVVNE